MFIATIIAVQSLDAQSLVALLDAAGCQPGGVSDVEERVYRVPFAAEPLLARTVLEQVEADIFVRPADTPPPRLFVADMDSTMITVECIDELADYAGVKPQVAEITERAMRGELDFETALKARVKLLAGLDESVLSRCRDERVRIMPGAKTLVRTLKARGVRTLLVSGGFTVFADRVAAEIGFGEARSNILGVSGGLLDGTVAEPILGADAKVQALRAGSVGMDPAEVIAVGDGANDIPMLKAAGLGIAYHGKPATVAAADAAVRFGDLTSVLHGLGVPRAEWVTA